MTKQTVVRRNKLVIIIMINFTSKVRLDTRIKTENVHQKGIDQFIIIIIFTPQTPTYVHMCTCTHSSMHTHTLKGANCG